MAEQSTEWLATTLRPNRFTGQIQPITHRVIELASGQNYRDEQGQWQPTQELFELTPRGAVARFGPHKVILAPNLNTAGAVDILGRAFTLPEGETQEVPVGKRFEVIEGRRILFESVPWPDILPWVNRLPRRGAAVDPTSWASTASPDWNM